MNYLLSFARSGNTWVRYCVEFLTNKMTLDGNDRNPILSKIYDGFNYEKGAILYKRHGMKKTDKPSKLIFLWRNPLSLIARENDVSILKDYDSLAEYYLNFKGEKCLITYEDVVDDISSTLKKILTFLDQDINDDKFKKYIEDIETHKMECKNLYINLANKSTSTDNHSIHIEKLNNNEVSLFNNEIAKYKNIKYINENIISR